MKVIGDKQYILDNYDTLAFDCVDKVAKVRNYLEQECGFDKANWDTDANLDLVYLYIDGNWDVNKVHGDNSLDKSLILCSLDYLISKTNVNDLTNDNTFKHINLKEV